MAGNFNNAISVSALNVQTFILPILKRLYPNCDFIHNEIAEDKIAKSLDYYAGIDLLKIDKEKGNIQGIASRVQFTELCYETFTTRFKRDSGTPTEFDKRLNAMRNGFLSATLTMHAYISPSLNQLLGMAIAKTSDIWRFIQQENPPLKHTSEYQYGQASFYVVKWQDLINKNYDLLRVTPINDNFIARWRNGEKILKGSDLFGSHQF